MSDVNPNDPTQGDPNVQEQPVPPVQDQTAENTTAPVPDSQTNPESLGGKTTEEVAREVLAGQWGRGHRREERLELAGYSKAAVQQELSRLLGTPEYEGVQNEGLQNTQDTREQSDTNG